MIRGGVSTATKIHHWAAHQINFHVGRVNAFGGHLSRSDAVSRMGDGQPMATTMP